MKSVLKHSYITIVITIVILIFSMWWAANKVLFNLFPPDGADTFLFMSNFLTKLRLMQLKML